MHPRFLVYAHVSPNAFRNQLFDNSSTQIKVFDDFAEVLGKVSAPMTELAGRLILFWEGGDVSPALRSLIDELIDDIRTWLGLAAKWPAMGAVVRQTFSNNPIEGLFE